MYLQIMRLQIKLIIMTLYTFFHLSYHVSGLTSLICRMHFKVIPELELCIFWFTASTSSYVFYPIAISGALCKHTPRSHPNQGQLCGTGGHCCH